MISYCEHVSSILCTPPGDETSGDETPSGDKFLYCPACFQGKHKPLLDSNKPKHLLSSSALGCEGRDNLGKTVFILPTVLLLMITFWSSNISSQFSWEYWLGKMMTFTLYLEGFIFFPCAVFYILLCHQPVYQQHNCS